MSAMRLVIILVILIGLGFLGTHAPRPLVPRVPHASATPRYTPTLPHARCVFPHARWMFPHA